MFRTLAKVPLRRCIHTSSPRSTALARPSRLGAVLAGSAVVATYFSWKTLYGDRIALDSVSSSPKQVPLPAHATAVPDAQAKSTATPDALVDSRKPGPSAATAELEEGLTEPTAEPMTAPAGEEESSGGAYNPVTGEINWDCPCLGGMAYGPCGIQFREAFSCFVYSEKEPKGIECVERFKAMQDCFREHPEVYGAGEYIMDDDEDDEEVAAPPAGDSPVGGLTTEATAQTVTESQAAPPSSSLSSSA